MYNFFKIERNISSSSKLPTCELKSKAAVLKDKFHSLHLAVRESSIQMDFEKFKFLVQDLLTGHDDLEYPQCNHYLN